MLAVLAALALSGGGGDSLYQYSTERGFLTMRDGARLAITWWRPAPRYPGEKFPVLLEYLPYRKDDSFYRRDFPLYDWFVRRGFLMAKVDVRGTGGSDGHLPDREYSETELEDGVEIIRQLAGVPGSSGRVGMWGISWGGFNAIQVAMRQPPALKAILALHASDDLFHDDVRFIDGGLHIDPYTLQIDHENGLPVTPAYALDSAYFRNRFEAYPWVLTYMKQPVDGPFWRRNALRFQPEKLTVPAYFIGGLLDGYRDTPLRALEYLKGTVKVEIGPWTHDWPDNGTPGPNYEWRRRAVSWWNHWLRDQETPLLAEPPLMVFVRGGHPPDASLTSTPGTWRFVDWPPPTSDTLLLEDRSLVSPNLSAFMRESAEPAPPAAARLRYLAGFGTAGGDWWGEPTGDMLRDDAGSLVFDSPLLGADRDIIGFPGVRLLVRPGAPLATWTARLEDVSPDGAVSLVTGAVMNGTMHRSTLEPERLDSSASYGLRFDLHFTTWTFRAGHRIRLAVSNAQFPMIWPTPYPMVSEVAMGESWLTLPVLPGTRLPSPDLPTPDGRTVRPDWRERPSPHPASQTWGYDPLTGITTVEWKTSSAWSIGATKYDYTEVEQYEANERNPAEAGFHGQAVHRIRPPGRDFTLRTTIDIRSDSTAFHVTVTRRLTHPGHPTRERTWREDLPRQFH
jgi:uncharacterized protein